MHFGSALRSKMFFECGELSSSFSIGLYSSYFEWLEDVARTMDRERFTFFTALLWNIWNRRNMWYHENVFTPSRLDVEYVRALSLKHKKAQTTVTYNASYVRVTSWTHPLVDVVKANVDVAFIASTSAAVIDVMATGTHGLVIGAHAQVFHGMHTTKTVKVCAFATGIELATSHDWSSVIIEEGSMSIVNMLNSLALDRPVAAPYLATMCIAHVDRPIYYVHHISRNS
ncbi:hypothetical protein V6N11_069825 [Hibiscus sabdariffa]|uniref:RNase H type-1 domain-containing protein n=1 Tax=Hibiscus sabdariffa TaxID=183260 RepID=A0ABR2Q3Y4_9ROSI